MKTFKTIANKIIVFLSQIEEFQKKLWLKKKFVIDANYCITLDRIDEKYYEEILNIFFTNNSDKNDTEKKLRKIVDKDYDKDITWSISVFLRKSRYRNRNSYYKNIKKKS